MAYRENDSQKRNDVVHFDLMEQIGVLSIKDNGWAREVNIVAWNGGTAKVDIREWDPKHVRMSKGVTLFEEEAETLTKLLAARYGLRLADKAPARGEFMEAPAAAEMSAPVSEAAAACVAETAACMDDDAPAAAMA